MVTKLYTVVRKNGKVKNKKITIRSDNTVNKAIKGLIRDGYYVIHAITADWDKSIRSNEKYIDISNYKQTI